ncbi:MAG: hypothetical protein FJX46_16540 [Alphaproteobacteria bacterium]|nr:hypothetical protein [Alphaproteobacteria bacterium]
MFRRGSLALGLSLAVLTSASAFAFDTVAYDKYLADFASLAAAYQKTKDEFKDVQAAYAKSAESTGVCAIGRWALLFEKPVKDMEAERKNLESAHAALRRKAAEVEAVRSEIEKQHRDVRARITPLGDQYWPELERVTERMRAQYMSAVKDKVMAAYGHYMDGVKTVIAFNSQYNAECGKAFPGNDVAKPAVENAAKKIGETAGWSKKIRDLIS